MSRNRRRWIPAVLAPVIVAGSILGFTVQANAAIDLPNKSASQVLQMMNTNPDIAFSGRIVKKASMGLPPMNIVPDISQSMIDEMAKKMPKEMSDFLPKASAQGELALALEFFAGTHTANIYVDGINKARLQVLDLLSERDYIRNGNDLWAYDAGKSLAQHSVIDEKEVKQADAQARLLLSLYGTKLPFDYTSPAAVADYLVNEAGKYSTITTASDIKIADRGAYQITITPKNNQSLVASATIAIDAQTGLPLAARVMAVGQSTPAFEVAFESITFETPAASNFEFTPPAGTHVVEVAALTKEDVLRELAQAPALPTESDAKAKLEELAAQGWGAVAQIPASAVPAQLRLLQANNSLYKELTKPVAGGRVFTSALMNIYFADNGDVYAGSVTVARLLEVASQ
ncbi:MAG: LolA family protein [Candidatus Planktophila sp.]